MKIKSITKKVWVEISIEELENREEFAAIPIPSCISLLCPNTSCWTYCTTFCYGQGCTGWCGPGYCEPWM